MSIMSKDLNTKIQKTLLVITDGIGYSKNTKYNAFYNAKTPTYDKLFKTTPHSLIATYGEHIGLPHNQMGNSEVGHISIGCGQVLPSLLVQIDEAIKNDTLKTNKQLLQLANDNNNIHIIGLISDGGVHAHIEHIKYIAKTCANIKTNTKSKIWLHLISDGRDVGYKSVKTYIKQMQDICNDNIQIATLSGRFYAMDRDKRYERVFKAYDAMVNGANAKSDILEYVDECYSNEIYDEFIEPASFNGFKGIDGNDGVVFCNFRNDRIRELLYTLAKDGFDEFETKDFAHSKPDVLLITQYDDNLPQKVIFDKVQPKETIASIISKEGLKQAHIAESEKYAHVTFFFNGGVEAKHEGESHILVPSLKVASYADVPHMRAKEITDKTIEAMNDNDFIVINYANGDMVGHCGIYESAIKAVESVDAQLERIIKACEENDFSLIITSDHGNCEDMMDENGTPLTSHTVGDVFCFVLDKRVKEVKDGTLCNLANSVFLLMGLKTNDNMLPPLFTLEP